MLQTNSHNQQVLVDLALEEKIFDLLPKEIQTMLQESERNYSVAAVARHWLLWKNDGYSPKAFINAFRAHGNK